MKPGSERAPPPPPRKRGRRGEEERSETFAGPIWAGFVWLRIGTSVGLS
jgi:hypothetical protein